MVGDFSPDRAIEELGSPDKTASSSLTTTSLDVTGKIPVAAGTSPSLPSLSADERGEASTNRRGNFVFRRDAFEDEADEEEVEDVEDATGSSTEAR